MFRRQRTVNPVQKSQPRQLAHDREHWGRKTTLRGSKGLATERETATHNTLNQALL